MVIWNKVYNVVDIPKAGIDLANEWNILTEEPKDLSGPSHLLAWRSRTDIDGPVPFEDYERSHERDLTIITRRD